MQTRPAKPSTSTCLRRPWAPLVLTMLVGVIGLAGTAAAQDRPLRPSTWRGHAVVADELLVHFASVSFEQRQARHVAFGAALLSRPRADLDHLALPAGADLDEWIARYAALPGVLEAQPNTLHVAGTPAPGDLDGPGDPGWSLQWNLIKVRADEAWGGLVSSPDAVVAVIDSGVDSDHPDLADALVFGLDTYAGDADPEDLDGHGTHCCGIAAAVSGNGEGVAGTARGATLLAYRCGDNSYPTSALVPAIDDAVSRGALVISMSWGSYWNDPLIAAALADAAAAGVVLVAAAGNDAVTAPFYPAAHAGVIGVASSRQNDQRSSFSNYGAWVDVAAPGQGIYSTWKNGVYLFSSGTSMACPLVAGMAAQLYANLDGSRNSKNAASVRAAVQDGAVNVGTWVAHGRVDFKNSVDLLFDTPAAPVSVSPDSCEALAGATLTVHGQHLQGLDAVRVGGVPASWSLLAHDTLNVRPADQPQLGPVTLELDEGGVTTSLPVTITITHPPRLEVPAQVADGGALTWAAGAQPGHQGWLLAALDGDTFVLQGQPILLNMLVLIVLPLDGAGLADLPATLPLGFGGISFYSQLVDVTNGAVFGVSAVRSTTILP